MRSGSNQKLTDVQIETLKELKQNGVRISFISKILQAEGLAPSAAYYHLSDNRDAYCNTAKTIRKRQREKIQHKIGKLIDKGLCTGEISKDWGIDLKVINKIYTT